MTNDHLRYDYLRSLDSNGNLSYEDIYFESDGHPHPLLPTPGIPTSRDPYIYLSYPSRHYTLTRPEPAGQITTEWTEDVGRKIGSVTSNREGGLESVPPFTLSRFRTGRTIKNRLFPSVLDLISTQLPLPGC